MQQLSESARTESAAAPLPPLPEYLLRQPGRFPTLLYGDRHAVEVLHLAAPGSTLELTTPAPPAVEVRLPETISTADRAEWEPTDETKCWNVLKVNVPKLWTPTSDTDSPPPFIAGHSFAMTARLCLQFNFKSIQKDSGDWGVLTRRGEKWVMIHQHIDRLWRPDEPCQKHPLCEGGYSWQHSGAVDQVRGINRKLLARSHSPKVWAIVCCSVPHQFRDELTRTTQPAAEGGAA